MDKTEENASIQMDKSDLPSAGLLVVSFPAGWSAIFTGGLGFLLIPGAEGTEEAENVRVLIPGQVPYLL